MTQEQKTPNDDSRSSSRVRLNTHYSLLGVPPSASVQEIRRAYRELSKRYHPDTTNLPVAVAKEKFHQLNEAYATLSSPERRSIYDQKIGYSRIYVVRPPQGLAQPVSSRPPVRASSAYLDPSDRPLSAGELFALFILGVTFLGCLILAVTIGLTRGETAVRTWELSLTPKPTVTIPEQSSRNQSSITDFPPGTGLNKLPTGSNGSALDWASMLPAPVLTHPLLDPVFVMKTPTPLN